VGFDADVTLVSFCRKEKKVKGVSPMSDDDGRQERTDENRQAVCGEANRFSREIQGRFFHGQTDELELHLLQH